MQKSCLVKNTSSNFEECTHVCGDDASICSNVWKNNKCGTEVVKYYFNSAANLCQEFKYYSCLGNDNKFDTLQLCQQTCVQHAKQRRAVNRTFASKTKGHHYKTIVQRLQDIARQSARWEKNWAEGINTAREYTASTKGDCHFVPHYRTKTLLIIVYYWSLLSMSNIEVHRLFC